MKNKKGANSSFPPFSPNGTHSHQSVPSYSYYGRSACPPRRRILQALVLSLCSIEHRLATVLSPNSGEPDFRDWLHEAPAPSSSCDLSGARVKKLSGTHVDSFWLLSLMDQPFLRTTGVDTLLVEQICETLFRDLCLALDESPA